MKKSIETVMNEIINMDGISLKKYYEYVNGYGQEIMFKIFNSILEDSQDKDNILNKYFNVYFSFELEDMEMNDDTYVNLVNNYGEDRINNYFKELLEVSKDTDKLKQKYDKIYFYIDTIKNSRANDIFDDSDISNCDDSVKMYLKEMCTYDLLSYDEEKDLLKRLANSRKQIQVAIVDDNDNIVFSYIDMVLDSVRNKEQFNKLKKLVGKIDEDSNKILKSYINKMKNYFKNNDRVENNGYFNEEYLDSQLDTMIEFIDSKEKLVNSNLRLVVSIAKRYASKEINILDLISEGNIGLMRAIRKFDCSKETRISTYATWWIRQMVNRYIADNLRTVRIPVHLNEKIYKYNQAVKKLEQKFGVEPSEEMLADYLGCSIDEIINIRNVVYCNNYVSLDGFIGKEDDNSLIDFIADDNSVEEDYFELELRAAVDEVLGTLTDKEAEVIRYRFGFIDGRKRTLEEVGSIYGVTRERIRQIENKALRKLKNPARAKKLSSFIC